MAKQQKKVDSVSATLATGTKVSGPQAVIDKLKGVSSSSKSSK